MAKATTSYSSAPISLYDIYRDDFLDQNYQVPVNNGLDMGSEESFYPASLNEVQAPTFPQPLPFQRPINLPYFQPRLAPTFPTNGVMYNGGMAPTFQPYTGHPYFQTTAPSFTTAPNLASSSSSSPQYPLTPSPVPLRKEVPRANHKSKANGKQTTRNATQTTKRELLAAKLKRKRGPNKRPAGTAFSNLLNVLPNTVKDALERNYQGCCETVNTKDVSTRQKHVFSKRHCRNLPKEYQELVPNFVCPAFVAMKGSCKAKAGRYDSTDRHCRNCVGFNQIKNKGASPVVITRAQYSKIDNYRNRTDSEGDEQATEQADIQTILADIFRDGLPDWFPAINREGAIDSGAIEASTSRLPTDTTSVPILIATHFDQPSLSEFSLFDPETAKECAEALKDGFPVSNHESANDSGAITDSSSQLPTDTTLVPVPLMTHFEQPSLYEQPLFDLERVDGGAESQDGIPPGEINHEGVAVSDDHPPTMSAPVPVADALEQSFYHPPLFDLESWPFFSNFPQT